MKSNVLLEKAIQDLEETKQIRFSKLLANCEHFLETAVLA